MREILFRGKTEKGEWVEGNLIIEEQDNSKVNFLTDKELVVKYFIQEPKGEWGTYRNEFYFVAWKVFYRKELVIPETVGQFTGLTDKNGKKIFEGDIVDCWSEGKNARGTVQQRKDGLWIIYPSWQKNIMWGLCPDINGGTTVEVIGNIHDNPELVEVEQ